MALRRLALKLNRWRDFLERGCALDPEAERELRLSDLELAIRLGEWEGVDAPLQAAVDEAAAAGDRAATLRARGALATLAQERRERPPHAQRLPGARRRAPPPPRPRVSD